MKNFINYDLTDLKKELRVIIPKDFPIPALNKNSTSDEILDAVNFLEIQGKYNQKIKEKI